MSQKEPTIILQGIPINLNTVSNQHRNQSASYLRATNSFDTDSQQEDSKFLKDVDRGLKHFPPELIEEGEGGSYFIRNNKGRLLAVFKPSDQDPYSPRNPKLNGRPPLEIKRGILPGEAAIREVAAYTLDHQHFSGVPLTLCVRLNHPYFRGPIEGSIQKYVNHDLASWDIGPGAYDKGDVQRIALLDLRLLNTDRHGGNILVRRVECGKMNNNITSNKLIPIDHGMCLPDSTLNYEDLYFEWENWPKAKLPFEPFVRRYVEDIDLWAEVKILRGLNIREECIRLMVVTSTLVKVTVSRGFSPSAIAQLMRRVGEEINLDQILPEITGPAVLSSLLFQITSWVESNFPRRTSKHMRSGSSIARPANTETINANPTKSYIPRFYHRQNSAPVLFTLLRS